MRHALRSSTKSLQTERNPEPSKPFSAQEAGEENLGAAAMTIRNWRRWWKRSRRAIGIRAWLGLAMIAGGLLFLAIHLGESTRKSAERKMPTSTPLTSSPTSPHTSSEDR